MPIEPFKYVQAKWVYGYHQPMKALRRLGLKEDASLLVIGSGFGKTAMMASQKFGCSVIGAEIAPRLVESANRKVEEKGLSKRVSFQAIDPEKPFLDVEKVDGILFESVLSFVENPGEVLSYYSARLNPGAKIGVLEVSFQDKNPERALVKSLKEIFGENGNFRHFEVWEEIFRDSDLSVDGYYPGSISMRRKFWDDLIEEPIGTWIDLAKTIRMTRKDPGAKKSLDLFRKFFDEYASIMNYGHFILTKK